MTEVLSVRAVSKSFSVGGSKIEILKGLDLSVKKSEVVAIVGQSGSGKSTLLGLLSALDQPDQGAILLAGKDLAQLSMDERTMLRGSKIGIIFQQFHLIPHLTALENVMLPLEIAGDPDAATKALSFLEKVGLGHRIDQLPGKLSGGEAQRVALARALVHSPEIVLADEPSGSLDPSTGDQIMQVFFDSIRSTGRTAILVTHNYDLAKRCDRVLTLRAGQLHEGV